MEPDEGFGSLELEFVNCYVVLGIKPRPPGRAAGTPSSQFPYFPISKEARTQYSGRVSDDKEVLVYEMVYKSERSFQNQQMI